MSMTLIDFELSTQDKTSITTSHISIVNSDLDFNHYTYQSHEQQMYIITSICSISFIQRYTVII